MLHGLRFVFGLSEKEVSAYRYQHFNSRILLYFFLIDSQIVVVHNYLDFSFPNADLLWILNCTEQFKKTNFRGTI